MFVPDGFDQIKLGFEALLFDKLESLGELPEVGFFDGRLVPPIDEDHFDLLTLNYLRLKVLEIIKAR